MAAPPPLQIPNDRRGFHTIVEPSPEAIAAEEAVDIIAVHGLGGDAFSTWTDGSTGRLWLYDFLPQSVEGRKARIATFGYDAHIFTLPLSKNKGSRTIVFAEQLLNDISDSRRTREERERPIIFIAHSLGGIVVKGALNYAKSRSTLYGNILQHTASIVFFGTPHMGSDKAGWLMFLTKLSSKLIGHTPSVGILETWSDALVDISISFSELADDIQLTTFFEKNKTWKLMIVPEASARLYKRLEVPVQLDADHLTICKFSDIVSDNYQRVLRRLETIISDINEQRNRDRVFENTAVPVENLASTAMETPSPTTDNLQERLRNLRD